MLRILRRQVRLRAPSPSLLTPLSNGASDCDASGDPRVHSSSSETFCTLGKHLNRGFMSAWLAGDKNASFVNSSFKRNCMEKAFLGHHGFSSSTKDPADASETPGKAKSASSSAKTLEDFQHEEIVGPTVERDMSPVADELRKAHLEMREAIQKFTKALLAVGTVHLMWGGMMFRAMDSPFGHALMTQVGVSALVLFGLAYYSRQTLKPIEFFTRIEERSRIQILTLSLQVTKTLSSFFQRGYGVGLVLFVALVANLVGCFKFLF